MAKKINLYMETGMGIISIPFIGIREADLFTTCYNSRFDKNEDNKLLDVLVNVLKLPISANDIGRVYLSYDDIESVMFNYDTCLPVKYSKDNYNINSLIENFSLFLKRNRSRLDHAFIRNVRINVCGDLRVSAISDRSIDVIAKLFLEKNYRRMRDVYFYLNEIDSPGERYNIKIDKVLSRDSTSDRKDISKLGSSEDNFVEYLIELSSRSRNDSSMVRDEFSKIELEDIRRELGGDSDYIFDGLSNIGEKDIDEDVLNLEECTGINIGALIEMCNGQVRNSRRR